MSVTTLQYRVGSTRYVRGVLGDMASRWWWVMALPMVAAVVAGFADWRWWVAAIALALVLYPGALAMAYYYHALSPEAAKTILPQTSTFSDSGLEIVYFPISEDGSAPKPDKIPYAQVAHWTWDGQYMSISRRSDCRTPIYVPATAFERNEDLREALSLLRNNVTLEQYQ